MELVTSYTMFPLNLLRENHYYSKNIVFH